MSNIFINRNRSQGAYTTPQLKQKFYTTDQIWQKRADKTFKGEGDNFYKKSMKFGHNPDLSPRHTGIGWSIVDSCDYVKLNQDQMQERYNKTETTFPLHNAYNIYEDAKQSYEKRLELFPGVAEPGLDPTQKSNGFVNYLQSGGISKKEDIKGQIHNIAERIARAKEIKGTLCLNNRMANNGSYKTPPLDLALQSKSGFKGGETAQRFYTKFPIYRPREHGAPAVTDDLNREWARQTSLHQTNNSMYRTGGSGVFDNDKDSQYRYSQIKRRNNSMAQEGAPSESGRALKMAGKNTLFPKRERFNEDTESVIQEMHNSNSQNKLKLGNFKTYDAGDLRSNTSKRSLTKSQLSKYFKDGRQNIEKAASERFSQVSKRSNALRNNLANKLKEKELLAQAAAQEQEAEQAAQADNNGPDEMVYIDNEDEYRNEDPQIARDELSVATADIDRLSVAPTEQLANEYERLMDQYQQEQAKRQALEQEIENMQQNVA